MKLILKILLLFLSAISAHTELSVFNGNPVSIQWQEQGAEYEYMVEIYKVVDENENLVFRSVWVSRNEMDIEFEEEGSYHWMVYIKEKNKSCEQNHQCFNIESGYFDLYLPVEPLPLPDQEDETKEDGEKEQRDDDNLPKQSTKKEEEEIEKETNVLGISTEQYIAKKDFIKEQDSKKSFKRDETEKKSSRDESNYCEYFYNIKKKRFKLVGCNIDKPEITSSSYYKYKDKYVVNSKGSYQEKINVYIETVTCKDFDLLNTKTWFRCDEVVIDSNIYENILDHEVYFLKEKIISPTSYIFQSNSFEISKLVDILPTDLIFKGYFSINHRGQWLDQQLAFKKAVKFSEKEANALGGTGNTPYGFPFNRIIHVNQWHGCTVYQCPHKGIDFAANRENIYASDNGTVVSKGYDNYYGDCRSGGNYLVVKYDSGHHMAYLHLEKDFVNLNQTVKRGDLIAVSGNSGSYNCQPLGYHLHFELREGRSQSTHINPVPLIDVNWDLVKSNMSTKYPGRLSGDNPHPKF